MNGDDEAPTSVMEGAGVNGDGKAPSSVIEDAG